MWDFFETVRHRHSVRHFRDQAVEQEKLHAILEMACVAPSAGDLQSYHIVVATDAALRSQIAAAAGQPFVAEAPVILVFCADPGRAATRYGERGRDLYALQDATISAAYAQLAVVAAGLASTWVGAFNEQRLAKVLEITPGLRPIAMLCLGYPAELPEITPRRHLNEMVEYR